MNIFNWLEEITLKKSDVDSFSTEDWEGFNSYMIHKFISMNPNYIEIANLVQTTNPQNKKQVYTIYKELIPKRKVWLKYLKSNNKKTVTDEMLEQLKLYFKCSKREILDYIKILSEEDIENILIGLGLDKKEIKKLKK
jgi:hypothetical protein